MFGETLLAAAGLAAIHLFGGRLRFLDKLPRSRWLSLSAGVAVAYVIMHLLPELQNDGDVFGDLGGGRIPLGERALYLVMLIGLVVFYGLERLVQGSKGAESDEAYGAAVFRLHVSSYAVYNALLGYLLVREDRSAASLAIFVVGIGLHFVVNDYGIQHRHPRRYRHAGRWVLAIAILLGWSVGFFTEIHPAITATLIAFLAGGILLNTIKEELPEERDSRFWAFAIGALGYAGILLAI